MHCAVDIEPERNRIGTQDGGVGRTRRWRDEPRGCGPDTDGFEKRSTGEVEG
jgi:hypothetical protein